MIAAVGGRQGRVFVSVRSRAIPWKTGVAILAGCCLAAVIGGASAMATAKAAATGTAPPVDHQLCYSAAGLFKVPTTGVQLYRPVQPQRLHAKDQPPCQLALQPGDEDAPGNPAGFQGHESASAPGVLPDDCRERTAGPESGCREPVRNSHRAARQAQRPLRSVLEEPHRAAAQDAEHPAEPQPLHLLPGQGHQRRLQAADGDLASGRVREDEREGDRQPGTARALPAGEEDHHDQQPAQRAIRWSTRTCTCCASR